MSYSMKFTEYFSKVFGPTFSLLFIEDARGFDPLAAMQRDHGAALIRGSQQSHHDDKATHSMFSRQESKESTRVLAALRCQMLGPVVT
jgi:hypothetical protein